MNSEKETAKNSGYAQLFKKHFAQILPKPRRTGTTMVFDKGLGLRKTQDLLEICHMYIDFWKIGFGSSLLYDPEILRKKIELINTYNIITFPGGTLAEIALAQNKLKSYLRWACGQGFQAVEISDGTVDFSLEQRKNSIRSALGFGLTVFTEVGKKDKEAPFHPELIAAQMFKDLEAGAEKIIVEARESGTGIMVFNKEGDIVQSKLAELLARIPDQEKIIWETPLKKQQVAFLKMFGSKVNLGNIAPDEILSLASLRTGLRSDTLKEILAKNLFEGII